MDRPVSGIEEVRIMPLLSKDWKKAISDHLYDRITIPGVIKITSSSEWPVEVMRLDYQSFQVKIKDETGFRRFLVKVSEPI